MNKEGDLRVWNIVNPPNNPLLYSVSSPKEGKQLIDNLADEQLKDDSITSNAFGLKVFEDGEWCEWYNHYGDDISEAFEED